MHFFYLVRWCFLVNVMIFFLLRMVIVVAECVNYEVIFITAYINQQMVVNLNNMITLKKG